MIADYPYFGFPNYIRHMNSGPCPPSTSKSIPNDAIMSNRAYSNMNYFKKNFSNKGYPNKNYNPVKNTQNSRPNYQFFNTAPQFKSAPFNRQKRNYSINHIPVNTKKEKHQSDNVPVFNLLGINLYFDDVLLILVIFFLYNENVNDPYLFITLILLLLT